MMTAGGHLKYKPCLGMTRISKPVTLALLWLWAGAAIMFAAITAPTLFNPNVLDDRELSGAIAGAILKRFFLASTFVFVACALFSLLGWLADPKTRRRTEFLFLLSLLLLGVNLFQDKVARMRMVELKLEMKNTTDKKHQTDLRNQFNDWHRISTTLYGGSLILALIGAGWVTLTGERKSGK